MDCGVPPAVVLVSSGLQDDYTYESLGRSHQISLDLVGSVRLRDLKVIHVTEMEVSQVKDMIRCGNHDSPVGSIHASEGDRVMIPIGFTRIIFNGAEDRISGDFLDMGSSQRQQDTRGSDTGYQQKGFDINGNQRCLRLGIPGMNHKHLRRLIYGITS